MGSRERKIPINSSKTSLVSMDSTLNKELDVNECKSVGDQPSTEVELKLRKKVDRNLREQQRSHRITEKIDELRHVLELAGVHFYKRDKQSTLLRVMEFIENSQDRSAELDKERTALLRTISETNERTAEKKQPKGRNFARNAFADDMIDINYKNILLQCPAAIAIISLDGNFLHCNPVFETISGYSFDEMIKNGLSIFHVLQGDNTIVEVWNAMRDWLQQKEEKYDDRSFWRGTILSSTNVKLTLTMTIAENSVDGRPLFFHCCVTESES